MPGTALRRADGTVQRLRSAQTRLTVLRGLLIVVALAEAGRGLLFLWAQPLAFSLTFRPLLDPVIARQYGLFSLPVALFYALLAWRPERYQKLLWVAVAHRMLEVLVVLADPLYRTLPFVQQGLLAAPPLLLGCAFLSLHPRFYGSDVPQPHLPAASGKPTLERRKRPGEGLRQLLFVFGGFQLFWVGASIVFLPVGERLLNYQVLDVFMTQQQGVAVFVAGAASFLASTDVRRYRDVVWVLIATQALGMFNAAYEASIGTIPWSAALIQWTIQLAIIGLFVVLYRRTPAA
jgi:hypothetical protein